MRAGEVFRSTSEQVEGKWVRSREIGCDKCIALDHITETTHRPLPPEVVANKFRQRGWEIGKSNICPQCVAAKAAPRRPPEPAPVPPPIIKPEPPKVIAMTETSQPTPEVRRAILDAIEEHWNHDRKCYRQAFSDKALGAKLNKPAIWVADIREKFYYPVDRNEARDEAIANLQSLEKDTKAAADRLLAAAQEAEALNRKIAGELAKLLKAAA
jgi:hypothetical protein